MSREDKSDVTLYRQVEAAIARMISTEEWETGRALPSEKELEQQFGVSRITVRRALDELDRRGIISRSKGRPAQVAPRIIARASAPLEADFVTMIDIVRGTESAIKLYKWQFPTEEVRAVLQIAENEPVLRVDRCREVEGKPLVYTIAYVPAHIGAKLDQAALADQTMLDVLFKLGVKPVKAEQTMSATTCSSDIARDLDVKPGSAIFQINRIVYESPQRPIQALTMFFRGDRFSYDVVTSSSQTETEIMVSASSNKQIRRF